MTGAERGRPGFVQALLRTGDWVIANKHGATIQYIVIIGELVRQRPVPAIMTPVERRRDEDLLVSAEITPVILIAETTDQTKGEIPTKRACEIQMAIAAP